MRLRLIAVLLVLGCTRTSARETVFGAAGPWTEDYGVMNRRGIELAVADVNARPAWRARPLRIRFHDDGGDGVRATEIARRFVDDPGVLAVIGHVNSGAMVSAARVYDGRMPALATTASAPALSGISSWTFRVIPSDSMNGADIARYALRRGYGRVAILYENNPYGRGLADAFRRTFSGEVIVIDPIAEGAGFGFEPHVSFLKARDPDAIFVAGTNASGREFLREVRRQGLRAALIGGDGWSTLASDTIVAEGVIAGVPFTGEDTSAIARDFVSRFRARYGVTPDHNAALAYDATRLLARAVEQGATSRERLRDYLAGLDERTAYPGVTGRIRFNQAGDPVGKSIVMTRITRGALRLEPVR